MTNTQKWIDNNIERDYPSIIPIIYTLLGEDEGKLFIENKHYVYYAGINSAYHEFAYEIMDAFRKNHLLLLPKERYQFLNAYTRWIPYRIGSSPNREYQERFENIDIEIEDGITLKYVYQNTGYGWDNYFETVFQIYADIEKTSEDVKKNIEKYLNSPNKFKISNPYLGRWGNNNDDVETKNIFYYIGNISPAVY